jgi:hypothetical protein
MYAIIVNTVCNRINKLYIYHILIKLKMTNLFYSSHYAFVFSLLKRSKNRISCMILLFLLFLSLFGMAQKDKKHSYSHPNIVYILADDLGYGDLGVMAKRKLKHQILMLWQKKECCLANITLCRYAHHQGIV